MMSLKQGDIFRFTSVTARWRVEGIDREYGFITLLRLEKNVPQTPRRMILVEEWTVYQ